MEIKVQCITVNEGNTEKAVLSRMRAAVQNDYEYILKHEDIITRFSSNQTGPIRPLIAHEKLINLGITSNAPGCILVLELSADLCSIVKIKNGLIRSVDISIKDATSTLKHSSKQPIVIEECIKDLIPIKVAFTLPSITNEELEATQHRLIEQHERKVPAYAIGIAALLTLMTSIYIFYPEASEPVPEIKKEPTRKLVVMDRWHDYKKSFENKLTYQEIVTPLVAISLIHSKLPQGWQIEQITATNSGVHADIQNRGGRTLTLKHFRDSSGYKNYIDIDGQFAQFFYPLEAKEWFQWTKKSDDFDNVRDDFMDQMILLGGQLRSNTPVYHQLHTTQEWEVMFESKSLAYLDVFTTIFENQPVFFESFTLRPIQTNEPAVVNFTFKATIIGR